MSEKPSGSYQVLARKYRPARFNDLIGQEPMVRTLRNAFAAGRIPHAWMLTGVRGVGKTTTARILARALNYEREDGTGEPTVDLPEDGGVHGTAILEGRHPDVVEMDAASHTGIDDIRDIIESARYMPVSARNKVYIIDEVHMLSKAAFNGLLKTLEEPPDHVKFIFATTEIRKVPVTVLSRCQRFDLHRVDGDLLTSHLSSIAQQEGVTVADGALAMITRAAEGSVRDALSILDQAIAHGDGTVTADAVQSMLGLADRTRTIDLFETVMRGDIGAAIETLEEQYSAGADAHTVLSDLAEFVHFVTRLKLAPDAAQRAAVPEEDVTRGSAMAEALSVRVLSRAWQILLKGLNEVQQSPMPLAAAEMVLVRLCHAADLPTPDELVTRLQDAQMQPSATEASGKSASTDTDRSNHNGGLSSVQADGHSSEPPRASPSSGSSVSSDNSHGAPSMSVATALDYAIEPERPGEAEIQTAVRSEPEPEPLSAAADGDRIATFSAIVDLAKKKRDRLLVFALERQIRLVRVDPAGRLELALTEDAPPDLPQRLGRALTDWTGQRWMIIVATDAEGQTIHAQRQASKKAEIEAVRTEPLVAHILETFEGAQIVDVKALPTKTDDTT